MKSLRLVFLMLAVALFAACAIFQGPESTPPLGQWRAIHLGVSSEAALETLGDQLPALADKGINVLILEINYGFEYQSHPELRLHDRVITRDGARRFARICRELGIRPIPQFQCLAHQSWAKNTGPLLTKYPEFDLTPGAFPNNEGLYCREWNPLDPRIHRIAFALMDELIDAFEADALHVGMDEVFLLAHEQSPATRGMDPAALFAKAVNDYYDHLVKKRGVEMLMWGDRLIDATKMDYGRWEASDVGTAPAIDWIPKDIIICDWHYGKRETYPSVPMFIEKGFRVLPSGWNKPDATLALIDYAAQHQGPQMLGHLFTTWSQGKELLAFPPIVEGLKRLNP